MKRSIRISLLGTLSLSTLVSYQNCAPGFSARNGVVSSSSTGGSGGGSGAGGGSSDVPAVVDTSGHGPGSLKSSDKQAGDLTMSKVLTWNLGSEIETGEPLSGVTFSVSISKFEPTDGSPTVLFVTAPTITTGSKAIDLQNLRFGAGGVRNDVSTTFQGLNQTVPANSTVVLSRATLLHQLAGPYSASQTVSLHFNLLWPNGVPLPSGTPGLPPVVTLDGAALYTKHCASCHGPLAISSKRGSSAAEITRSFRTAPSMSYLAALLSPAEVEAIAGALK
ncbi:MAG: cytochrome c [Proteobacteria bacterium]|nr:MAG: cytochrome c [Pseudomonadota bacterium]